MAFPANFLFRMYSDRAATFEENLITEDSFDIQINVFQHTFDTTQPIHIITSVPVFQDLHIMPCEELLEDVPRFLRPRLSRFLSFNELQYLASHIICYARSMVQDRLTTLESTSRRLLRLIVDVLVQEDPNMVTYRVVEQSMQQWSMVPATEEAIASLRKLKVVNHEAKEEQCSICLENFEDDDEVSAMPCDHVFHKNCIVDWLKTSHVCPLCRFQMPVE